LICRHADHFTFELHLRRNESEEPMLCGSRRDNDSTQSTSGTTELCARLSENPPFVSVGRTIILQALRPHSICKPLIAGGKAVANLSLLKPIEVQHKSFL
jgi:hypothetical protein